MIKPQKNVMTAKSLPQDGERLSKHVAHLMRCSRREAEQYIEGGWVQVNGQVVEEPMARVTDQTVRVDPHASLMALTDVTLLLHKPPGFDAMAAPGEAGKRVKPAHQLLLPARHWAQDAAGVRVLKHHFAKLTAGVPLEVGASGLVVFTQEPGVWRRLVDDAITVEHELWVDMQGVVAPQTLAALQRQVRASVNRQNEAGTRLRVAAKGLRKGQLGAWCEAAGLQPDAVHRARLGRLAMGTLAVGQWRLVMGYERF